MLLRPLQFLGGLGLAALWGCVYIAAWALFVAAPILLLTNWLFG